MPNISSNAPDCEGFAVVNDDGGVVACYKYEMDAQAHLESLIAESNRSTHGMFAVIPSEDDRKKLSKEDKGGLSADDLHVTLCYLGDDAADRLDGLSRKNMELYADNISHHYVEFDAHVIGPARMGDGAMALLVESPTFNHIRDDFRMACAEMLPADTHPNFIPHVTLDYNGDVTFEEADEFTGQTIRFNGTRLAIGDELNDFFELLHLIVEEPTTFSGSEGDRSNDEEIETRNESEETTAPEENRDDINPDEFKGKLDMDIEEARNRVMEVTAYRKTERLVMNDHRNLPEPVQERLDDAGAEIGFVDRAGRGLQELRFRPEVREREDGKFDLHGYVTVYNHSYPIAGGPPYGFNETIRVGAGDRTVAERDDVRLLVNHDGIPLARTKSGTLFLESDDIGIYVRAPELDPRSPLVQSLISAMSRGDMDEMSVGMRVLNEEWDDEYMNREITELMLFDASVVTIPANPLAMASLRDADDPNEEDANEDVDTSDNDNDTENNAADDNRTSTPIGLAMAQLDALDI